MKVLHTQWVRIPISSSIGIGLAGDSFARRFGHGSYTIARQSPAGRKARPFASMAIGPYLPLHLRPAPGMAVRRIQIQTISSTPTSWWCIWPKPCRKSRSAVGVLCKAHAQNRGHPISRDASGITVMLHVRCALTLFYSYGIVKLMKNRSQTPSP